MAFFADLKDTSDNCDVCEGEGVRVLIYLLRNCAKKLYMAYAAYEKRTGTHVYLRTWTMIITALIQRYLTENVQRVEKKK